MGSAVKGVDAADIAREHGFSVKVANHVPADHRPGEGGGHLLYKNGEFVKGFYCWEDLVCFVAGKPIVKEERKVEPVYPRLAGGL